MEPVESEIQLTETAVGTPQCESDRPGERDLLYRVSVAHGRRCALDAAVSAYVCLSVSLSLSVSVSYCVLLLVWQNQDHEELSGVS